MQRDELVALVEKYFASVDGGDFEALRSTLTDECVFTVETHGIELKGIKSISGMFDRLWAEHKAVQHKDFIHVPDADRGRIASRFTVVNTELNGDLTYKSNCNFFYVEDGRFSRVAVYMAGPNTLHDS